MSATKGTSPGRSSVFTSGLMSSAMTLAPRAWNSSAMARPIPLAAPVTITTLPAISLGVAIKSVISFLLLREWLNNFNHCAYGVSLSTTQLSPIAARHSLGALLSLSGLCA
ncbi:hypothetical protein D3C84_976720 [compost metagenome]